MKHNFFYSILLMAASLTISLSATAQQRSIVQGICTNEKGKTVENVSVYVNESQLIAITDENGCFTYTHAKAGDQLRFAHMAFEPQFYTIKEEDLSGKPS